MSLRELRGSKAVTVLVLIILPSIFVSILTLTIVAEDRLGYGEGTEASTISGLLIGVVWLIGLFWYIPYYTKDKPEKYFTEIGYVQAAMEYQFSRKLLSVFATLSILFPLASFLVVSFSLGIALRWGLLDIDLFDELSYNWGAILFTLIEVFFFPTFVLAIRFAVQRSRKDFDFHLTRAYFMVSSQNDDSVHKIRYLLLLLDTYNKFLERNLKVKIKDIMRIYSLIMSASAEQKIKIRESIGKALEKDKLELARQLAEISHLPDEEEFLRKERTLLSQQLKDILTIIIPAIISVVGFIIAILTQARILA